MKRATRTRRRFRAWASSSSPGWSGAGCHLDKPGVDDEAGDDDDGQVETLGGLGALGDGNPGRRPSRSARPSAALMANFGVRTGLGRHALIRLTGAAGTDQGEAWRTDLAAESRRRA